MVQFHKVPSINLNNLLFYFSKSLQNYNRRLSVNVSGYTTNTATFHRPVPGHIFLQPSICSRLITRRQNFKLVEKMDRVRE